MRVTLVTETFPPDVNGVARTLALLALGLLDRGHQVHVIRPHPAGNGSVVPPAESRAGFVETRMRGLPIPGYAELRFGFPAARKLRRAWSGSSPDVVHVATEGPLGWSAVRAARSLSIPVTSCFHTNFHDYAGHYRLGVLRRLALVWMRRLHNRTLTTLVPTPDVVRALSLQGFARLAVLERGVDANLFRPERRDEELRASWGADERTPVAIYVGRLASEKNIDLSLRAMDAMKAVRPDLRRVLVGDGPSRDSIRNARSDVHLAGMRHGEDLARHYASGDVFVFASRTETFGNVVTEAMASGLVVLAFDEAAARRHVRSWENGVTVSSGDDEAFLAAARDLALGSESWPALRAEARRSVESLSWDAVIDQFERVLSAATARDRIPPRARRATGTEVKP